MIRKLYLNKAVKKSGNNKIKIFLKVCMQIHILNIHRSNTERVENGTNTLEGILVTSTKLRAHGPYA